MADKPQTRQELKGRRSVAEVADVQHSWRDMEHLWFGRTGRTENGAHMPRRCGSQRALCGWGHRHRPLRDAALSGLTGEGRAPPLPGLPRERGHLRVQAGAAGPAAADSASRSRRGAGGAGSPRRCGMGHPVLSAAWCSELAARRCPVPCPFLRAAGGAPCAGSTLWSPAPAARRSAGDRSRRRIALVEQAPPSIMLIVLGNKALQKAVFCISSDASL